MTGNATVICTSDGMVMPVADFTITDVMLRDGWERQRTRRTATAMHPLRSEGYGWNIPVWELWLGREFRDDNGGLWTLTYAGSHGYYLEFTQFMA